MADSLSKKIDWNEFRRLMPVAERWAYFDHAAVAPLSGPAREAIARWSQQAAEEGDTVWPEWARHIEKVRECAASLIGADAREIALVPNTTAGINLVAEGFPWKDGDNVITLAGEFPSNLYPWMNLADRGVEERRITVDGIEPDFNRIVDSCDERTKIIAISWVGYSTGWRIDVEQIVELAHQRGILVFLDAIQGLGVFPLDVKRTHVDFLAADGHKWMLGPEGAGLFFLRSEHLDLLRPLGVGWHSVVHAHDFTHIEMNYRLEAARYEGGSQNMVGFLALGENLKTFAEFGLSPSASPIANRVLEINAAAAERLESIGANIVSPVNNEHSSGILAFEMPGSDPVQLRQQCLDQGVALSHRAGRLRISPHAYANDNDIESLVSALTN